MKILNIFHSFHEKLTNLQSNFWSIFSRSCKACGQTFPTKRGLKIHAKKSSSASLCRRYGDLSLKAASIKDLKDRKSAAASSKPSQVDLSSWDGKIKKGSNYGTLAKTICLNAIKVSQNTHILIFTFRVYSTQPKLSTKEEF